MSSYLMKENLYIDKINITDFSKASFRVQKGKGSVKK